MLAHEVDREEFAAYFGARLDVVRRTAYLLCGDWHLAEDLAQNALIRLAASWHKLREPAAVDAYVRTCLVRAYFAESKRAWRRRERTVAQPPESRTAADTADDVTGRLLATQALAAVPPKQRAALVCRYFWDLDCAETARILGCSPGTVKSQTARALAALRSAGVVADSSDEAGWTTHATGVHHENNQSGRHRVPAMNEGRL